MKYSQVLTAGVLASFFSLHVLLLNHLKLCLGKKQEKITNIFFLSLGKGVFRYTVLGHTVVNVCH